MRFISLALISLALIFVLLGLGIPSSLAQGGLEESSADYSCWMCPVCGYTVQLQVPVGSNAQTYSTTLSQVTTLDPNDPSWYCPSCYYYSGGVLTFAGNFVLVPCQSTGYGQDAGHNQSTGYGQDAGQDTGYGQNAGYGLSGGAQGQGLQSGFGQQSGSGQQSSQGLQPRLEQQSNPGQSAEQSALSGSQKGDDSEATEKLQGKVLMVVCPEDFQMTELDVPKSYFEERGLEVEVASSKPEAVSMDGDVIETDLTLDQVKLSHYSAAVFVGGDGIELQKVYDDPEFISLAKKAGSSEIIIGAICLGPNIIANAGLLEGKRATGSDADYLASKGADVVCDSVARDGKIITGSGPDASEEFAKEVALAISESRQPSDKSSQEPGASQPTSDTAFEPTDGQLNEISASASSLTHSESMQPSGTNGPESGTGLSSTGMTGSEQSSSEQSSSGSAAQSIGPQEAYKCSVCGYTYDPGTGNPAQGVEPGTPFENLPSMWRCPICGAGKDKFEDA